MSSTLHAIHTDALVIGAGPVGLFQIFELGLQEISVHVVDVLPEAGGQCMALYADKPIYDIPGLPASTGRDLTQRLLKQIEPFRPRFHFREHVSGLQATGDGAWHLSTEQGTHFVAKTVFIAAGVGAFVPRRLTLPALQAFEGSQLFYAVDAAPPVAQQHLMVVGGDDEAVQAACEAVSQSAASVTVLHRRQTLDLSPDVQQIFEDLLASKKLSLTVGQITEATVNHHRLQAVQIETAEGDGLTLPCDQLWVKLGLSPQLGPLADWGLAMSRKQLNVNTEDFSTSVPGIYAVGDVNTYPGKRKLIVSGFHEATLAAFGAAAYLRPGQKVPLEYTTASPRLHRLLGVSGSHPHGGA